ncbi:MAG: L-seryl-tRNA(Sec) selenium transferase [Acidobacteria bacterium RIFCSPLOWO2_12_FULL_60_22]|nr:MAG: L-seryl-tRNA(Sec) selenium transferase [Acidobacteria bacterium RIFCSPLOWO2_12_FULL_60_22]
MRGAEELLREIPAVEEILNWPELRELLARTSRKFLTERVREVLAGLRQQIRDGQWPAAAPAISHTFLQTRIREAVDAALSHSLRPVINATGVILHTNLGRAPLARDALQHAAEVAGQYSNLEYDLDKGRRGERDSHISGLLRSLLGAPAAIVVNNNAAAVLITLNTLAEGGEVIVSRGELIEIGGSFRIPEIMAKSGATLREVGTTNRTRISDYQNAITERTKLLLRVHPSNFRIIGFTEKPSLEELVGLGRKASIPVFEDLGSGCLVSMAAQGIQDEIPVGESLAAGVDVVSFSGDKLLGGPQAGVIAGKKDLVERIRRNPLFRALRVDKLTYSVLASTLQAYWLDRPERIPTLRMIQMTQQEVGERAQRLLAACAPHGDGPLRLELVDGKSVIGGGSAPGQTLPSRLLALRHAEQSATVLETRLRGWQPPVIARVEEDRVLLDLRTVLPEQEEALREAILSLASG